MPIYLPTDFDEHFDSRGLPIGYDPHNFYEYRYLKRVKEATGLEGFIYQWIPKSVIQSFAIAFDPLSQVKVSLGVVTPTNRTRIYEFNSDLHQISLRRVIYNVAYSSEKNWQNIPGAIGPVLNEKTTYGANDSLLVRTQEIIPSSRRDTTRRTRSIGSDVGELRLMKGIIRSPSRHITKFNEQRGVFAVNMPPGGYPSRTMNSDYWSYDVGPQAATLPSFSVRQLETREIAFTDALMRKYAIPMFKDINPQGRNYSLFRNIVELRDVPRSIDQLKNTMINLSKLDASIVKIPKNVRRFVMNLQTSLKDIPKEYLSYHFGWKQTMNDALDLLVKPGQITKQINLLIARNGKPTTYRSKRSFVSADTSGVSGFDYYVTNIEATPTVQSRIEREVELRMVLNTTFTFPTVDLPTFQHDKFMEKLGVYPRFIDIYNLIPWTWLVDWFTGFGNYLEVIENINHDKSLINWGFLTAINRGQLITDYSNQILSTSDVKIDYIAGESAPQPVITTVNDSRHRSVYDYKLQIRRDLSSVLDVKSTASVPTLSAYQQSILGALLAQRLDFKRNRHIGG